MPTVSQGTEKERGDAEAATSDVVEPLWKKVLNDRFTILEPIGSGGMGKVYKAIQSPLDRIVAVKILKSAPNLDPGFRQRFFLEASLTSRLRHPNTVTVIDYGETPDGIFYLAMEYLDGQPLSQILAESGSLSWLRCLHICQQVCRSLREAHKLGIVHRDLKPSNVMLLTEDGDQDLAKVLDFGLVKSFVREAGAAEAEITTPGIFLGSPQYMSPEQLRGQADPRSDIYSLGVMLYQMLVGKPPFVASDAIDVMFQHMNTAPVPLRSVRPDLAIREEIERVVLKCLEKKPAQRYQSMDEVLEALRGAGMDAGAGAERALSSADSGPRRRPETVARAAPSQVGEQTLAIDIEEVLALPKPAAWSFRVPGNYRTLVLASVVLVALAAAMVFMVRQGRGPGTQATAPALKSSSPERRSEQRTRPQAAQASPPESRPTSTPTPVAFRILSEPVGARVLVNGKSAGLTPLVVHLAPGADGKASAELVFQQEGFQPLTVITGGAGPEVVVNERLEPLVSAQGAAQRQQRGARTEVEDNGTARSDGDRAVEQAKVQVQPKIVTSVQVEPKIVTSEFLGAAAPPPAAAELGAAASVARIELDETKLQLTKISGPDPQYTPQALDHEVEGVMLVKCVITLEGAVQDCRVIKGLPFMDRAVVYALQARKYRPYVLDGQPVEIDYTFKIKLTLPR
jgi:serine/threonine-protein kinase